MLNFDKITYKNILSVGNKPVEIVFNQDKKTLITGTNGGGKSTLIEALSLVLYGKPFRSIKKPSLVNSINKKQLHVELELSIGDDKYVICRGIKPNVFSVSKNGTELEQHGASADFQEWLEENVLKMSFTTFKQIIVLGTAGFEPFMDLAPIKRRQIVEDLVDVGIFTKMSDINKLDIKDIKTNLTIESSKLESLERILQVQEKNSTDLLDSNQERIDELTGRVTDATTEFETVGKEVKELTANLDKIDSDHEDAVNLLKAEQRQELTELREKSNIDTIEADVNKKVKDLNDKRDVEIESVEQSTKEVIEQFITARDSELEKLDSKLHDAKPNLTKFNDIIIKSKSDIDIQDSKCSDNDKRIAFFSHTVECPTCDTSLDDEYRERVTRVLIDENLESGKRVDKLTQIIVKCKDNIASETQKYDKLKVEIQANIATSQGHYEKNVITARNELKDSIDKLNEHFYASHKRLNDKLTKDKIALSERLGKIEIEHRNAIDLVVGEHDICTKVPKESLQEKRSTLKPLLRAKEQYQSDINALEQRQEEIRKGSGDVEQSRTDIASCQKLITKLTSNAKNLTILQSMLKDDGIKAKVIKQYIPFINSSINNYLQTMGSKINFTLDEEFNEKIKSRGREEFTYNSFSQGEKMRIDVAIMFTWRDVIRKRTKFISNLLIMDEVMDGASDDDGIKSLHRLIDDLDDNVIIISHNETHDLDKFDRHLIMQKKGNFTHKID